MKNEEIVNLNIGGPTVFDAKIKYTETDKKHHFNEIDLHTHDKFEIYVNVDGDISFFVNNSLYPVSRGEVIVSRPGEQHHCIYRSEKKHKLFWILFDCDKNLDFFDFLKKDSVDNFFSPTHTQREELLDICRVLHDEKPSKEETLYLFLRIFAILKQSKSNQINPQLSLPDDLTEINHYIDQHMSKPLTVSDICDAFYLSQSTLERRFKQTLDMTPLEFIRRKKLIFASRLLKDGYSVLQAGINTGYNDNSYFIELFKRYFGCTPYEYKKRN